MCFFWKDICYQLLSVVISCYQLLSWFVISCYQLLSVVIIVCYQLLSCKYHGFLSCYQKALELLSVVIIICFSPELFHWTIYQSRIQGPGSRVQGSGIPARVSSQLPGVEGLEIGWMDGWMGGCEWMDGWMWMEGWDAWLNAVMVIYLYT